MHASLATQLKGSLIWKHAERCHHRSQQWDRQSHSSSFARERYVPVYVVTGGGLTTALTTSNGAGWNVLLACRSEAKGNAAAQVQDPATFPLFFILKLLGHTSCLTGCCFCSAGHRQRTAQQQPELGRAQPCTALAQGATAGPQQPEQRATVLQRHGRSRAAAQPPDLQCRRVPHASRHAPAVRCDATGQSRHLPAAAGIMAPEKLQVTEDGMEAQFQVQLTATAHPPCCSACGAACCVTQILSALVFLQLAGPLSCPADLHDTRAGIMQPCCGLPARTTFTLPPEHTSAITHQLRRQAWSRFHLHPCAGQLPGALAAGPPPGPQEA